MRQRLREAHAHPSGRQDGHLRLIRVRHLGAGPGLRPLRMSCDRPWRGGERADLLLRRLCSPDKCDEDPRVSALNNSSVSRPEKQALGARRARAHSEPGIEDGTNASVPGSFFSRGRLRPDPRRMTTMRYFTITSVVLAALI